LRNNGTMGDDKVRREREGDETGYIAKIKDLLAECQHMAAYGEEAGAE